MASRGHHDAPALLRRMLDAALRAVHPAPVTAAALRRLAPSLAARPVHLLALGKASLAMAGAATAVLAEHGLEPAGGLVVTPEPADPPHPRLAVAVGDHPYPGDGSRRAAARLAEAATAVEPDAVAVVLLSGGTSSLIGAPVSGVSPDELQSLTRTLLGAGADIAFVNGVRRRVARWGAGRLAVALAPAAVHCLVLSDVPGYDPALVGSGPCAPDPTPAAEVLARLHAVGVHDAIPASVRDRLADVPDPADPAFGRVAIELLADNRTACDAAARQARAEGLAVVLHPGVLSGEARTLGAALAATLRASPPGTVHVWGGEPAVTLDGAPPDALGGRMQELALAAAKALDGHAATLLASGTDGRDGPTDASGAMVGGTTWARIAAAGRDPAADLAAHRSHAALDAARALLRDGPTGTNVADIVVAIA